MNWWREQDSIEEIIRIESPIHSKLLVQRVGDLYGFARVGSKIEAIIGRSVEMAIRDGLILRKDGFLWNRDSNQKVQARINGPEGMPRNIEYVAIDELISVIEWLLQNEFGLPKDALIKQTAQVMGYDRTGDNVRERIERAIESLLKQGKINKYGDQIILKEK